MGRPRNIGMAESEWVLAGSRREEGSRATAEGDDSCVALRGVVGIVSHALKGIIKL